MDDLRAALHCPMCLARECPGAPALAATPKPTLDAAWAEAEAALPEGCRLYGVTRSNLGMKQDWRAAYEDNGGWFNFYGDTPAAALRSLAARLHERTEP